ncbi:hypothetical protein LXA43DRAFT_644826 [Ganoderma leucocontextum]|nr:hypothetical protein LXA43DRAFT_644826 [Ganoderma leucocontextum]
MPGLDVLTVRLWEANTFQQLHPDEAWEGQLLALSPDGRRVLTGVLEVGCIWNVASGKLHRALRGHTADDFAAAFNSDNTRVVTAAADSTIRTWDAETGEGFLILQVESEFTPALYGRPLIPRQHVVYSPDGERVLS